MICIYLSPVENEKPLPAAITSKINASRSNIILPNQDGRFSSEIRVLFHEFFENYL